MPKTCLTILVPSSVPGLAVMTTGPSPPNSSALARDQAVSAGLLWA